MSISELETPRLYLRQFRMDDLNDLSIIRSDPDVMRLIGTGEPQLKPGVKDVLDEMLASWKQRGFGRWAVILKEEDKLVGWCGLTLLEETPEIQIGYGIAKPYWARGFSTEAALASLRYGFETMKIDRIVGVAMAENIASRRVMEKIGMRYEKVGHWYGGELECYAISRSEFLNLSLTKKRNARYSASAPVPDPR